jgi:hypothetical protein
MGDWYTIGLAVGLGVSAGVLFAGALGGLRLGAVVATLAAALVGLLVGLLVQGWVGAAGGILGGLLGAGSASLVARGALRRGGTWSGTALLLIAAAVVIGLLALIPVVGYVLAVLLPAVAVRRARRQPERYAGLRTLAK